jgi:hypothetical protein
MYVSAGLLERTIALVNGLMQQLYDLGQDVVDIESGNLPNAELSYQETIDTVVGTVGTIQRIIGELSHLYPVRQLQLRFQHVPDATEGLIAFITKCDPRVVRYVTLHFRNTQVT